MNVNNYCRGKKKWMTNLSNKHQPVVGLETPHDNGSGICAQTNRDPAQNQEGDGGADHAATVVFVEVDLGHDGRDSIFCASERRRYWRLRMRNTSRRVGETVKVLGRDAGLGKMASVLSI